jgi:hypothetical protein
MTSSAAVQANAETTPAAISGPDTSLISSLVIVKLQTRDDTLSGKSRIKPPGTQLPPDHRIASARGCSDLVAVRTKIPALSTHCIPAWQRCNSRGDSFVVEFGARG